MKNDPHLLLESSPAVIKGRMIKVLCEKEIANAQPTPVWDEVLMGKPLDLQGTNICIHCQRAYLALPQSEREKWMAVYAIVEGKRNAD